MKSGTAFTKKDLAVVLGCVVFMLMNLGAIGSGGRSRAKQAVCLSNLRQWGTIFSTYANDNGGYNPPGPYFAAGGPGIMWMSALRKYAGDSNDLYFCPMATIPGTDWSDRPTGARCPNKAWGYYMTDARWGRRRYDVGSYGISEYSGSRGLSGGRWDQYWKTPDVKTAGRIPMLADCTYVDGTPLHTDSPPQYDGEPRVSGGTNPVNEMNHFSTNRHNGSINMLFMDWSVRAVGLKELWTLKWHRKFNTAGFYTKAGGRQPEDWPRWMRHFKDY